MEQSKLENYLSERGAHAYWRDHQSRLHRKLSDRTERRILTSFLGASSPHASVLDLPCGFGRLFELLRSHAPEVHEADISPSMLALNERLHAGAAASYRVCSALEIPSEDGAFDTVVSVRLNHHLDSVAGREQHLAELCRVARRNVIVSFFSHTSLKNLLRRARARFDDKRPKNTLVPARVVEVFSERGFDAARMVPLSRIGSGHVFGLFRRRDR